MKILILGAKGMLGQELAKQFATEQLYLWDKEQVDIADKDQSWSLIKEIKPELIINAAAYNAVDEAEKDDTLALKVNFDGPRNLAEISQEINSILIHYSTDYIFNGQNQKGYTEDSEADPINKYGRSKWLGEKAVREISGRFYVIRPSRIFGFSAISEGAKKSFVDVMVALSKEKQEMQLVDEEYSCPTYAPDLAKLTKQIFDQGLSFGVYHGANTGACTWYGFAREIFQIIDKKINLIPVDGQTFPRPAVRPQYSELLNTKLPSQRSWQEALQEYLELTYLSK